MACRISELAIDDADPVRLAALWSTVLGDSNWRSLARAQRFAGRSPLARVRTGGIAVIYERTPRPSS